MKLKPETTIREVETRVEELKQKGKSITVDELIELKFLRSELISAQISIEWPHAEIK